MDKNDQIRSLISHDGLRDALTGLMSLPSFLESAVRELSSARRAQRKLNLFLISLIDIDVGGKSLLIVRSEREASQLTEDELYNLSGRVLDVAKRLSLDLRSNDLIARYALADFLVLNSGNHNEITSKLAHISKACGAVMVGIEIIPSGDVELFTSNKNFDAEIREAIAELETKVLVTLS